MKRRILALILTVLVLFAIAGIPGTAASMLFFTAVDDSVLPLRSSTMPTYFNSALCVPMSVFSYVDVSSSVSNGSVFLTKGTRQLTLDLTTETATDQNGATYSGITARLSGGVYFLPVDFMCSFFSLNYTILPASPASVLRITTSSQVYDDRTFLSHYAKLLEETYENYTGEKPAVATHPATGTTPPTPVVTPTTPVETPHEDQFFNDVTVFLSFYAMSAGYCEQVLDLLAENSLRACFFVTAGEILNNAELVRRISGEGHSLGIWLETANDEEFSRAQSLLFDAARIVTPIVSSPTDAAEEIAAFAGERELIYRPATVHVNDEQRVENVIDALPTVARTSGELRLACSEHSAEILPEILDYLRARQYRTRAINETSSIAKG